MDEKARKMETKMGTCVYDGQLEATKIGDACKNSICWNIL